MVVDVRRSQIVLDGTSLSFTPKQRSVLVYLIDNIGRFVPSEELLNEIWSETYINEQGIKRYISEIRKLLGRGAIKTQPKIGYQFIPDFFAADFIPCPWRGFEAYDESSGGVFFGRSADCNEVLNLLKEDVRLISLFGPSGVGKTSLVNAGIIPALRNGEAISGSDLWKIVSVTPRRFPLLELSSKLASVIYPLQTLTEELVGPILQKLSDHPDALVDELQAGLDTRLVLFIDQVEGLLVQDADSKHAESLINFILQLISREEFDCTVVLNLRNSFLSQLEPYREFYRLLTRNLISIDDLNADELKEVIDGPAKASGLNIDNGLSDKIVSDFVSGTMSGSGVLPLLSNFMVELFGQKEKNRITIEHYSSMRGIEYSIETHATELYDSLHSVQQEVADKLLTLLTDVGENPLLDFCKTVREDELFARFERQEEDLRVVIECFEEGRLLVRRESHSDTIELAHSSLIRHWPKMQDLLSREREFARMAESIEKRYGEWIASGKTDDDLLKGTRLDKAKEFFPKIEKYLHKELENFYHASSDFERRQSEVRTARESRRKRLRYSIAGLIILVVGAVYTAAIFFDSNRKSEAAKTAADAQMLLDKDPGKALVLAIEAASKSESIGTTEILKASAANSLLRRILKGHNGAVMTVAVSKRGDFVASSSRDKTVRVWDAATGKIVWILNRHANQVESVSIDPYDKLIATADSDGLIIIWDPKTGEELKRLDPLGVGFNNIAFGPEGESILAAGEDGRACIWEFNKSDQLGKCFEHTSRDSKGNPFGLNSAVFSPDGKYIATGSGDKTAIIWEVKTGKSVKELTHPDSILNLEFNKADSGILVTACKDGVVRIWDTTNWSMISELRGHKGNVNCAKFNLKGDRLVTSSIDSTATVWNWRQGKPLFWLRGHSGSVTSAEFSPNGNDVYTSSGDTEVRVWSIQEEINLKRIEGLRGFTTSLSYSTDGNWLLGVADSKRVEIVDTSTNLLYRSLPFDDGVTGAVFAADGRSVAVVTKNGKVLIWDFELNTTNTIAEGQTEITAISCSPTNTFVATGHRTGEVKIWQINSPGVFKSYGEITGESSYITDLIFNREETMIAASSRDRSVKFFSLDKSDKRQPAYSWLIGTGDVNSITLSPDEKYLIASCNDKSIRFWDLATSKQTGLLLGHTAGVIGARFSTKGDLVASVSIDNTLRIWSTYLGRELYVYEDMDQEENLQISSNPLAVSINPKDASIAFTCQHGIARVVRCPVCGLTPNELLQYAKSRLPEDPGI